ncbi:MAG: hypothetical protein AAGM38_00010 [Pseudomonadota bacterium]
MDIPSNDLNTIEAQRPPTVETQPADESLEVFFPSPDEFAPRETPTTPGQMREAFTNKGPELESLRSPISKK